jgi:hypothetical protein
MAQRDIAKNFNFKKDYRISLYLYFVMMISFYVAFVAELIWLRPISWMLQFATLIFALVYFKILYQALKELYYSFWGLVILYAGYAFYCYFQSLTYLHLSTPSYAYLTSLVCLAIIAFIMSSPVYYPIFNWWEVDFRFRNDLKAKVEIGGHEHECRVSDMRRWAGCLMVFSEFELPAYGQLKYILDGEKISLPVAIATKSEAIPGRGFSYGFKFIITSKDEGQTYQKLMNHWHSGSKNKLQEKFKKIKQ